MSVYNDELYLREAIESMLNQTFEDFEFLIMNDGSTDLSGDIIRSYQESRIKFLDNQHNLGLARSLNRGINLAKGKYLARQDSNDVSHPDRLRKQYDYMEDTATDILGCRHKFIDIYGKELPWLKTSDHKNSEYFSVLLNGKSIFRHGAAMIRSETLKYVGGYNDSFYFAQDCELWLRFLAAKCSIEMLDFVGYYSRIPIISSRAKKYGQKKYVDLLRKRYLQSIEISDSALIQVKEKIETLISNERGYYRLIDRIRYRIVLYFVALKKYILE